MLSVDAESPSAAIELTRIRDIRPFRFLRVLLQLPAILTLLVGRESDLVVYSLEFVMPLHFGNNRRISYVPISMLSRDDDSFEDGDKGTIQNLPTAKSLESWQYSLSKVPWSIWFSMNVALFICSLVMATRSIGAGRGHCDRGLSCQEILSMPSPILEDTEIAVERKQMPTPFVPLDMHDLLRMEPSPEVDRAWQSLVDSRPVPIDRDTVLKIGKDPAQSVRIPESWGHGSDMYFGRIDVFHQIHCLDAIRREAHFEHYYGSKYPAGYNDTGAFHRTHLSHCLHLLLENIMCNANTDIYTHIWVDNLEHPWPDFQMNHQCRDFAAVQEWQKKHALDEDAFIDLRRPARYAYRTTNEEFKKVNGWFEDHGEHSVAGQGSPA